MLWMIFGAACIIYLIHLIHKDFVSVTQLQPKKKKSHTPGKNASSKSPAVALKCNSRTEIEESFFSDFDASDEFDFDKTFDDLEESMDDRTFGLLLMDAARKTQREFEQPCRCCRWGPSYKDITDRWVNKSYD